MPQREDGKNKALRIDLGYYRRRSWLGTFRWFAISVGFILSLLYGTWVLSLERNATTAGRDNRSAQLSTGSLALVHAHIENDCQSCHSEQFGIALAHDAWQRLPEGRLNLQEKKCNDSCHTVDRHFRAMLTSPEMDQDCARCHRDHLGRANLLEAVKSVVCTECHANLTAACVSSATSTLLPAVGNFSIESHGIPVPVENAQHEKSPEHPVSKSQFRSLLSDRGRVKFDHTQHMQPGQVDPTSRGGFQLSMLPEEHRKVYAESGQQDNDLVQLKCESCHIPGAIAESTNQSAIAREERRYAPINFNKHCEACHQISFAGQGPKHLPLPHVAQHEEFADLLEAKQDDGTPTGKVVARSDQANSGTSKSIKLKDERNEAGVEAVFIKCQQCHLEEELRPEVIARALVGTLEPLIPQRWLQYGYFNHAAHDNITRCAYCHPMPTGTGEPLDQKQVLIRGPESCVGCHRAVGSPTPPEFATAAKRIKLFGKKHQPTWASSECIECHRYHWSRPTASQDTRASASQ